MCNEPMHAKKIDQYSDIFSVWRDSAVLVCESIYKRRPEVAPECQMWPWGGWVGLNGKSGAGLYHFTERGQ